MPPLSTTRRACAPSAAWTPVAPPDQELDQRVAKLLFVIGDEDVGRRHEAPPASCDGFGRRDGQGQGEGRADAHLALHFERSTHLLDQSVADGEAQTGPLAHGLGGKEGLEDPLQVLLGMPDPESLKIIAPRRPRPEFVS